MSPQRASLDDGRLHFQHGPIDLVIGADGDPAALTAAHEAAWARFEVLLPELETELRALHQPVRGPCPLQSVVARRMWLACRPFHSLFITPMAAVAGSVAQEIVRSYDRPGISRAWVNNGGDIALYLAPGTSVKVGLFTDLARFDAAHLVGPSNGLAGTPALPPRLPIDADFEVRADSPVRGIATSGWRGRSFSLGIADSVTVLARTAAMADAASTMIANAVDVDDPCIARRPANEVKVRTDLGDIAVTVDVPPLGADLVDRALQTGLRRARQLQREGLIHAAVLVCQRQFAYVDAPDTAPATTTLGGSASAPAARSDSLPRPVGSVFA